MTNHACHDATNGMMAGVWLAGYWLLGDAIAYTGSNAGNWWQ